MTAFRRWSAILLTALGLMGMSAVPAVAHPGHTGKHNGAGKGCKRHGVHNPKCNKGHKNGHNK